MAIVSVLAGGIAGFLLAVFALMFLQVSWLAALGLWSFGGMAAASAMMVAMIAPRSATPAGLSHETA